ncbi:MAG: ribosome maturation factor RimM [Syntrophorhabdaceae bacterium]|nr:ribosome maturation factor RimM [Syntrophorhabdaceae bacterium]HOC46286.1 ribosome maturation factor RimM [Syntrophorhabdaceae bacterium]
MKFIPVGRVVSTSGLKGEVKFYYYNEAKEDFFDHASLFALRGDEYIELKPEGAKYRKNFFYLSFRGLAVIEEVSFLVTKELFVREEDLRPLDDDEYYEYRLIGLDVINVDGAPLGKVQSVLHTGANDILVVKGECEYMIPMVEGFIGAIDIENGTVEVNIEGLV